MAVQLAGLILISVICPVISVMAESLETLLLVHAASLLSTARLLSETRPAPASNLDTVRRSWHRRLAEHFQSQRTVGMMSLFCVATGFALLGSLAGSSTLETIQTTLRESYRPERADLLVGSGSILGSATCVLLFAGTAASFGTFPLHGVLMNGFESAPAGITGPTVLLQRLQASVVLWKTAIVAMPGFESTVLLLCVVFGAASCIGGSLLACRITARIHRQLLDHLGRCGPDRGSRWPDCSNTSAPRSGVAVSVRAGNRSVLITDFGNRSGDAANL